MSEPGDSGNCPGIDRLVGVDVNESTELWRAVVGYEGFYEVSDQGRVRSVPRRKTRGRILKQILSTTGYPQVTLSKESVARPKKVHLLVMAAFVGPRPEGLEIRHLSGIKTDNRVINLQYGTHSENMLDIVQHGQHNYASRSVCPRCGGPYSLRAGGRNGRRRRYCNPCNQASSHYSPSS